MIGLGCDVGSKATGLTVLDERRYLYRASVAPDEICGALEAILWTYKLDVVGIETMSQVFEHGAAAKNPAARRSIEKALLASRDVAGEIRGYIKAHFAAKNQPPPPIFGDQVHVIRKAVIGRMSRAPKGTTARTHRDRLVAAFVRRVVNGWPSGHGDNADTRDAAVAALWAQRKASMVPR